MRILSQCLVVLGMLAVASPLHAADVKLLSGGGFKSAVDQMTPEFERKTGNKIVASYGSEGSLRKRIGDGESFDVLVIGASTIDALIKDGKLVGATRKDIGRTGLAIAVRKGAPKPDISTDAKFKQALLETKTIAYIGEGHSGEYFDAMMQRLGIGAEMKPKLKSLPTSQVTKATANGDTDMTVWLAPGILTDPGVELVGALPADLQEYVSLSAGLSSAAPNADGGKALISYLTGDGVAAIKAKGWQAPPY